MNASSGWLPYGALWTTLPWPDDGPFDARRLEQRYERARRMAGVLPTGARRATGHRELAPLSRVPPGPRVQAAMVAGLTGLPLAKLGLELPDYAALSAMVAVPR